MKYTLTLTDEDGRTISARNFNWTFDSDRAEQYKTARIAGEMYLDAALNAGAEWVLAMKVA